MCNNISTLLKDFFNGSEKAGSDLRIVLKKMLNASNSQSFIINDLFKQLGFITLEEKVDEAMSLIALKKERLLILFKEEKGVNISYLYLIIKGKLFDRINKKNQQKNTISLTYHNSDEDGESQIEVEDEFQLKKMTDIVYKQTVDKYFTDFLLILTDEQKETLCYYLAKDKELSENPFLSNVEQENTKYKKVQRLKEFIAEHVQKKISRYDIEGEKKVWLMVFEKFWSEICLPKVNKSVDFKLGEHHD